MGWQDDKIVAAAPSPAASGAKFWEKDKASDVLGDLQYLPGFIGESLRKMLGGGALQGAVDINKLGAKVNPLVAASQALMPEPLEAAQKAATAIDVPSVKDASGNTPLWDTAMRGIGRAAVTPLPGAGVIPQALAGATSGMGGELGRRGVGLITQNPTAQNVGETAGAMLGGGPTALLLGPKMPVAQQDIARAFRGAGPEVFNQAAANARQTANVGARTATAAEMFDPNSPVMALATKVRGGLLDNALRQQTQGRAQDLQTLGETFLNRVGPEINPNEVANRVAAKAGEALEGHRAQAGINMGSALRGQSITPRQTTGLYSDLYNAGAAQERAPAGEAYREVAEALVNQQGGPMTDLQQLSLSLKGLKEAPITPKPGQSASRVIGGRDLSNAVSAAEMGLGELSPQFRNANDAFRAWMQGPHRELSSGPVGSLADKTIAGMNTQSPASRLQGLVTGNSPQAIRETAGVLNPAGPLREGVADTRVDPLEIARALAQQNLRGGATNPGPAVRGLPGSQAERQFSALLEAGGQNPAQTLAPLNVAERLQPFASAAGVNELPKIGMAQFIRPFRSIDMLMTARNERQVQQEIARILANPSEANIRQLQAIAQTNPMVRKALTTMSAFTGDTQE